MSGRQKWGDFKRRLTPEECLRVESKMADLRATLPPTTYAQVRWAAEEYNNGEHGYNGYYRNVYESDFRTSLLKRCSQSDAEKLVRFLNQWKSRRPPELAHVLSTSLPEIINYLAPLIELALDDEELDRSTFDTAEAAFDSLRLVQYVGPTTASKILGVLNPGFFVMWDGPIQKEYFYWEKRNGYSYQSFLKEMRNSALSIVGDARKKHGIPDPAKTISKEINQRPPFTLAKFINDYVWLTVTRKQKYPGPLTAQERYA
jgi:hypothetical protein